MVKCFASGLLVVGLVGCVVDQPELSSTAGITFEEFKAGVANEPGTGHYVVDWDHVVYSEDELLSFYYELQQGALAVHRAGGADVVWSAAQKKNLTYCISDAFGARKQQVIDAMKFASDDGWEKFADVNFTYAPAQDATCTAQNTNVLFDVSPISGAPYGARAFFPNQGRSERNVMVDSSAFQQQGQVTFNNIIAHELGHTLGFRHEHTRPEAANAGCIEDDNFRAVTVYDAASVMHYPQCGGASTTMAFTQRDREGAALIYGPPLANPSPMTQLTFPANNATVGRSFSVEASVVDTDLVKAELFIDGTLYQTLNAAPFTFAVSDLALGTHTLEITGTDSGGQVGTQTITVNVANGGPTGPGGGGGGGGGNGTPDEITGGCSAGGSGPGSMFVLVLAGLGLMRRRR